MEAVILRKLTLELARALGYRPGVRYGWRTWSGQRVLSAYTSYDRQSVWRPPFATAQCGVGESHTAPEYYCACGLHAFHNFNAWSTQSNYAYGIGGIVAGWGKMVIGEYGYRSQYMRPMVIFVSTNLYKECISEEWGCDVIYERRKGKIPERIEYLVTEGWMPKEVLE